MPESTLTAPTATPTATPSAQPGSGQAGNERRPPGYFNQAQLLDIALAEDVLKAAGNPSRAAALAEREIDAQSVGKFAALIQEAREKTTATGQAGDQTTAATLQATGSERALVIALQGIQSAAKQKKRMLEVDSGTNQSLSLEGYLIGKRLNANRPALLQNAEALIRKAKTDSLPGYGPAGIKAVEDALKAYRDAEGGQQEATEDAGDERLLRDKLVAKINSHRIAIQHAADALWPYTDQENRNVRRSFKLPLARPCTV